MDKELECTKIKDGLYLGNIKTAQDAQFLITNKFAYIVNCSAEIPNYFEGQGIKYLKFKLARDKTHKLWDEPLKKLKKLDKFIQTCEEHSMCCLIHSFDGTNRSLVMLVAFLMNRFRWKLTKALQFVRSKQLFIGLSEHYIQQLQALESILSQSGPALSSLWRTQFTSHEEQVISKTFLNSQQIQPSECEKKEKKVRRITWKDQVDKEKRKEQKQLVRQQQRERGGKNKEASESMQSELSKRNEVKQGEEKKAKKQISGFRRLKSTGNKSKPEIALKEVQTEGVRANMQKNQEEQKEENLDQDILKLLRKNLKSKKKIEADGLDVTQNDDRIYNVTINNYIKPNINILNNPPAKKKTPKQRPQSAWNKERDNINRTLSEKEPMKSLYTKDKSLKSIQKKGELSPRRKEKKTTKANSLGGKGK